MTKNPHAILKKLRLAGAYHVTLGHTQCGNGNARDSEDVAYTVKAAITFSTSF